MPVVKNGGVELHPPSWAKRLADVESDGRKLSAVAFFDEINTAPPATQASLLRVFNDKVVGDLTLPSTIGMIAAANPPEMAAGGWIMSGPLANRFAHFEWPLDPQEWAMNAISNWDTDAELVKLGSGWYDTIPLKVALISSYINTRPSALYSYPSNEEDAGKAWPSPRTWMMAASFLAALDHVGADKELAIYMISGAVGVGAGTEFVNWVNNLDLPNPEDLLKDPEKFKMPKRVDQQFAILNSVVSAVINKLTRERWDAAWEILGAAVKQSDGPDIAAFSAKTLATKMGKDFPPPKTIKGFTDLLREAGLF